MKPHKCTDTNDSAQLGGDVEYIDCFSAEGVKTPPNECPEYDTKQSDGEAPVMVELLGMLSIPLLPLLPDSLGPGVVAFDSFQSMSQIELLDI